MQFQLVGHLGDPNEGLAFQNVVLRDFTQDDGFVVEKGTLVEIAAMVEILRQNEEEIQEVLNLSRV